MRPELQEGLGEAVPLCRGRPRGRSCGLLLWCCNGCRCWCCAGAALGLLGLPPARAIAVPVHQSCAPKLLPVVVSLVVVLVMVLGESISRSRTNACFGLDRRISGGAASRRSNGDGCCVNRLWPLEKRVFSGLRATLTQTTPVPGLAYPPSSFPTFITRGRHTSPTRAGWSLTSARANHEVGVRRNSEITRTTDA